MIPWSPLGFILAEAGDGSEVLAACRRFHPDVILMDLLMPKMDGFTATAQLKKHEECAHIPVIAVTASIAEQDKLRQRLEEHGFSGYINKPYVVTELLETLSDLLGIELQYDKKTSWCEGEIILPPPELLDVLIRKSQAGDIEGVIEQMEVIAEMESGKYQAFALQINQLTDKFQLMAVEQFIANCKKD